MSDELNMEAERAAFEKHFGPKNNFAWRNADGSYQVHALQSAWEIWQAARSAPMGTNGEAIPLPPPDGVLGHEGDEYGHPDWIEGNTSAYSEYSVRQIIAQRDDRIRHLEQDNGLLSLIADQFKVRLASADARIVELERDLEQARAAFIGSENARKDAERARGHAALKCEKCGADRLKEPCGNLQSCGMQGIAYIDGRTAGTAPSRISAADVEWVVNDNAELGVKIGDQFFFLYKGDSLQYESGIHDDGTPMRWRPVGKREFGECCHPVKFWKDGTPLPHRYTDELAYMPGLSFGKPGDCDWRDLPAAPTPLNGKENEK